jgi:hypothetical protein
MSEMRVVEVDLGAEGKVLVPIVEVAGGDRTANTSPKVKIDVDELLAPVKALGGRIRDQVKELKPTTITLETGIAVAVRNGKLTALLVDGQADVSFTLTLEWDLSDEG